MHKTVQRVADVVGNDWIVSELVLSAATKSELFHDLRNAFLDGHVERIHTQIRRPRLEV